MVDEGNTAGFGRDAMVAIYTIHDPVRGAARTRDHESQGLAVSHDNGRTFRRFAGNPVLPNPGGTQDFRDPNVFRDEARGRWVMALSVTDHVRFYASENLRDWTYLSSFGEGLGAHGQPDDNGGDGVWECPNLFPIRDEVTGRTRWVLIQNLNPGGPQGGSGTQYFVGVWDGTRFTLDPAFGSAPRWLDHGADNYAGITWDSAPGGRRVFIGWMSNWLYAQQVPTGTWRSAMTFPRELTLRGLDVLSQPASEIAQLRGPGLTLPTQSDLLVPAGELQLSVDLPAAAAGFTVELSNDAGERLRLGLSNGQWFVDRRKAGPADFHDGFSAMHTAPREVADRRASLHLLIDAASVELFADGGRTVMTETFFPSVPFTRARIVMEGGAAITEAHGWQLRRADFGQ